MPRPRSLAGDALAAPLERIRSGASHILGGLRADYDCKCAVYPDLPGRACSVYLRRPAIEPHMRELNMPTGSAAYPSWVGQEAALLDILDQAITGERGNERITRWPSLEIGAIGVPCVEVQKASCC